MKNKLLFLNIIFLQIVTAYAQNGFTAYQMAPTTYSYKTGLKTDALGNKWISTRDKGIYKFDGINWTNYDTTNSGIASNHVNEIAFETSNIIWIATQNGVSKFDGSIWTNYTTLNSSIPSDTILSIYIDNSDVWIGTNNGLAFFSGNIWTIYNTFNSGIVNNVVTCINKNTNGDIWLGTYSGVCVKLGNNWINYDLSNSNIPKDQINAIYIVNNIVWVGTMNSGLFKFINGTFIPLESLFFNIPINSTPPINTITSISIGPQGGILINSFYEILPNQIHKYETLSTLGFTFGFQTFDPATGLVWAIKTYGSNVIYSFNYQNYTGTTLVEELPDYKILDVNEVRAGLFNRGDMFWDLYGTQHGRYEVPKFSGKNANFASALWIGGIDEGGVLHQAAQTYRQEGVDYFPGPLDTLSGTTDSTISNGYNKIWKIDRLNIEEFQAMFANGSVQNGSYSVNSDIITWPARGTGNYTRNMAPFVDVNGDGLYNPIINGDYPKISGDQMCYWIFNDSLAPYGFSYPHKSLQVEVHASAYAYTCSQIEDSLKALNYTTFYNYEIYNRSNNDYSNVYMGIWSDSNIGSSVDDFLGCNPGYNYGFHYNGSSIDGMDDFGCYGPKPPMLSTVILNGPLAEPNDNIDNNNDGNIDEQGEKNLMTSFISIDNNNSDSISGNPFIGLNGVYNYLSGKWKNGLPLTYGGNGINGNTPYSFMFDGIPGGNGWDEVSLNNTPGNRGFVLSCGPFNLNAGANVNFTYALVYTQDTASLYSPTNLFNKNLEDTKKVRQWYSANNYPSCYDIQTSIKGDTNRGMPIDIYPNPSSGIFIIRNDKYEVMNVRVYNCFGEKVYEHPNSRQTAALIDISSLAKGVYFVNVACRDKVYNKKIIIQ